MLAPGATCSISVAFAPSADFAIVDYPGAITVSDSTSTSPEVIGLSGSGVGPISSVPDSLSLQAPLGQIGASQTVTLTNNDTATESASIAGGSKGESKKECLTAGRWKEPLASRERTASRGARARSTDLMPTEHRT